MILNYLTDKSLLEDTKQLAQQYRTVTTKLLHHLREIEFRKLYSDLGYPSLFNYVVEELGFSEASASRRISAMRLIKEIPELEVKIESGDLTLSNIDKASQAFKKKNIKDIEVKKEILASIENTSTRTCQKTLLEVFEPIIPPVTYQYYSIEVRDDIYKKYETIRGYLASHHLSKDELIEKIFDIALKQIEIKKFKTTSKLPPVASQTKYIPAGMRKAVFERDGGACVICGSTYDPEIDHILAVALGGETTLDNLRLLCRSCNQRARISSNLHFP